MHYIIPSSVQADVGITMTMNLIVWGATEALRGSGTGLHVQILGIPRPVRGSHSQLTGDSHV